MWRVCLVVIGWVLITPLAHALNPELRFYQYEFDGPPENIDISTEIFDVEQDRSGFLWLATARGLAKYDGLEVRLFRVSEYPDLLSNTPKQLFVDSRNRLFIASDRGLSMYDGSAFVAVLKGNKWAAQIHAITEDADGGIWLGSEKGLWHLEGGRALPVSFDHPIKRIRSLLWHGNKLYAGGRGRIYVVEADSASVIDLPAGFSRARVRDLEYHQGRIWGATRSGLIRLEGDKASEVVNDTLKGLAFDILLSDRDQNLWFGGSRVIGRFYPDGRVELPNVDSDVFGYRPEVTQMFEDASGQHWHTSRSFGFGVMRDTPVKRVSFAEGLPSPNVTALASDRAGTIHIATDKGISTLVGESVLSIVTGDFSGDRSIQSLSVNDSRQLWIGTQSGLLIYDLEADIWLAGPEDHAIEAHINALENGADGNIWVATDTGLHDFTGDEVRPILETSGLSIESLLVDSHGLLWLGTENGVMSLADGNLTNYAEQSPQASGTVISMVELPSGNIVAATTDNGILVRNSDRWVKYGEGNGLPPEQLIDIEVRGQYLWLVSGAGVFSTALPALSQNQVSQIQVTPIVAKGRYRGAYGANCCRGKNDSAALLSQGSLIAATDDGVVIFDLDISPNAGLAPLPYIQSVSHSGSTDDLTADVTATISPDNNRVRIDYSAIHLVRGDQVEFRYRLRGQSEQWVEVGRARTAQFQNLPAGDYVFELQASSSPGVWSDAVVNFAFNRLPHFTETGTFNVLLWTIAIAIGLLLFWLRMAATRYRHKKLEAEIAERTEALRHLNLELATANAELRNSSQIDPLTGLVNRRFFDTNRRNDLDDSIAAQGVLMMIDIDYFKRVNDAYGHSVGDEVLCQFAGVLRSVTRQSDLVTRWGGEEFMLICRCPNDDAAAMLDRICSAVRTHWFKLPDGERIQITCSIGCIRYPVWQTDSVVNKLPILMEFSDAALYAVKMNGRDGWALLEGGENPNIDLKARRVGPMLKQFVDGDHLLWSSSRIEITPSMEDTVTRLRAIKLPVR